MKSARPGAIHHAKVRAFVLEPLDDRGQFSLDGEHAAYTPVAGELHPRALMLRG